MKDWHSAGCQAYLGVRLSVWSYNALVTAWEPVLEPWDVIAKLDLNSSATVRASLHAPLLRVRTVYHARVLEPGIPMPSWTSNSPPHCASAWSARLLADAAHKC